MNIGSGVSIESAKFNQWVKLHIDVYYTSNEYYVEIDNMRYGPFGFRHNGSAADYPIFHNRVDNYDGWFDNIR